MKFKSGNYENIEHCGHPFGLFGYFVWCAHGWVCKTKGNLKMSLKKGRGIKILLNSWGNCSKGVNN